MGNKTIVGRFYFVTGEEDGNSTKSMDESRLPLGMKLNCNSTIMLNQFVRFYTEAAKIAPFSAALKSTVPLKFEMMTKRVFFSVVMLSQGVSVRGGGYLSRGVSVRGISVREPYLKPPLDRDPP